MARYVGIEKYKQLDNIHYYRVETNDLGGGEFFVEINSKTKIMNIYKDRDCTLFACAYDFNKPDEIIDCDNKGINVNFIPYVLVKMYKAVLKNEFPQYLSHCA